MKRIDLDALILILFIALLTLLVMYAMTYDNYGIYKDVILTFISLFSFIILIFDRFIRKKDNVSDNYFFIPTRSTIIASPLLSAPPRQK